MDTKFLPYFSGYLSPASSQQFVAVVDIPSASSQINRFMTDIVFPARNWGVAVGVAGFSLTMIVGVIGAIVSGITSK